ncbi:MAG: YgjV family protein [Bdellovibrionota bacterium]
MNNLTLIGQALSFIGASFTLSSIFSKHKKNMILLIMITNLFCALSCLCLGGYSGIVAHLLMATRHALEIKGKLTKNITIFICVAMTILGLAFNKNSWIGIFPITASISFAILAYLIKSVKYMRIALMLKAAQWAIFDFYIKAYPMFVMNIIIFLTAAFEYIRNKNKEIINEAFTE